MYLQLYSPPWETKKPYVKNKSGSGQKSVSSYELLYMSETEDVKDYCGHSWTACQWISVGSGVLKANNRQ